MNQQLTFVFVHGLSGWGSYDPLYKKMPYWGMRGGDLMKYLEGQGFACYAASVAPTDSAWDRACELYAQIAGTVVDYGKAHSARFRHERFGRDFSSCPLIPRWDPDTRLVLLGHSFGGVTVRLFAHLLANGSEEEREASGEDLSPLFRGGLGERVHSVVTLAAPTNGTTSYDLFHDPDFDPDKVKVPWWNRPLARLMASGTRTKKTDDRDPQDYAVYDMRIDHAIALNRTIQTLPWVYYFSLPCSYTVKQNDGTHKPRKKMEPLFVMRACQVGAYTGKTEGGRTIDESWLESDGLVNTISAAHPWGAPAKNLDRDHPEPGIWQVFPPYQGDHMALQGGMTYRHDVRALYKDLLQMIAEIS